MHRNEVTMKTNIKNIFFGVVLLGHYHICDGDALQEDFKSLQERSPFGDTPKPEPKPQKQVSAAPVLPPAPKKPEMKLGFTGFLRLGGKDYYAICDKTSKDTIHTVLEGNIPSPLGYSAGRYDPGRRILDVRFNGFEYPCSMGADEKKSTVSSSSSKQSSGTGSSYGSGGYGYDDYSDYDDYGGYDDYSDWGDDYGYGGWGDDYYGGGYDYGDYDYGAYDDYDSYGDYGGYDDYGW
ncbi:MAG: hypothetical protein LBJ81_00445 [Puniceicoccales bacterium]|jgi:hypothetical protein|nr:hypothetical protein [Puniceicoccales bacterium]